jgi:hypothetical protein
MSVEQSYAAHAHRPVATNVAAAFCLVAIVTLVGAWLFAWPTRDAGLVSLSLAVATLVLISRTYIVRLQDRIILLEMKVRGAELLTPEQEVALASLAPKQIIALRFASDPELAQLVQRAARERLSPDQIKREIKQWRPDTLRT